MAKLDNQLERDYQVLPRTLIQDNSLSLQARFIYCYMASKPDGWEFYKKAMAKDLNLCEDTLTKYLRELINSGWIDSEGQSVERGKFGAVRYIIKSQKAENFRDGKFPTRKNTDTEKTADIKNKDNIKSKDEKESKDNNIYIDFENFKNGICKNAKSGNKRDSVIIEDLFNQWWNAYDKKVGKDACIKAWARMSQIDKEKCLMATPAYVQATPDKAFRKDPLTYLHRKGWEDEIIIKSMFNQPTKAEKQDYEREQRERDIAARMARMLAEDEQERGISTL